MKKKTELGFSVMDMILLILAAVCIFSAVFHTPLQHFLGQEKNTAIEYTFLIQNASLEARNYPKEGEEIFLSETHQSLGKISQIGKTEKEYREVSDPEDVLKVVNLTLKAQTKAYQEDAGFVVGEVYVKPGAEFFVQTESASFSMMITMVKIIEE